LRTHSGATKEPALKENTYHGGAETRRKAKVGSEWNRRHRIRKLQSSQRTLRTHSGAAKEPALK
jgi:hypothetical protein